MEVQWMTVGSIVQDWAVYQAQSAADLLGIDSVFHPDVTTVSRHLQKQQSE